MERDFCLGGEWLYYKIYTGVKTADSILLEKIAPIITHLKKEKVIKKWFFIRYKDTDEHIRLRVFIKNKNHLFAVISKFHPIFKELMQQNLVWKIQTDTYKREIERYGINTIEDSEFIFWKDSEMILRYLKIKSSFVVQELPLLFSFYAIDSFLNSFQLSNYDKLSLLNELQISLKKEFEIGKEQKKELDKNYRLLSSQIDRILSTAVSDYFPHIFHVVNKKSNQIKQMVMTINSEIEIPIHSFISNHIHMLINRQYSSQQRRYELIIYDHLHRHYKTLNYRDTIKGGDVL